MTISSLALTSVAGMALRQGGGILVPQGLVVAYNTLWVDGIG